MQNIHKLKVISSLKPETQLSQGQGKTERHDFYCCDQYVGFVDTEQWPENGLLVLSGEMRAFDKRIGTGSEMIKWLIKHYPKFILKPVRLGYEGALFWAAMAEKHSKNVDPFDYSPDEYSKNFKARPKS